MNCSQIAAYLNEEGVTSWTGKQFYPELVFGVLRKAKLKAELATKASIDIIFAMNINDKKDIKN